MYEPLFDWRIHIHETVARVQGIGCIAYMGLGLGRAPARTSIIYAAILSSMRIELISLTPVPYSYCGMLPWLAQSHLVARTMQERRLC